MAFLSRLFGKAQPVVYPGDQTLDVVGESFRQDTLWKLAGGYKTEPVSEPILAVLVPEPGNPEDENAIMVQIDGNCVGYLTRNDAALYLPGLNTLRAKGEVALEGLIIGGGPRDDGIGFLGVFLDHDPRDFKIPRTGHGYGSVGLRTGFSEAVETDY